MELITMENIMSYEETAEVSLQLMDEYNDILRCVPIGVSNDKRSINAFIIGNGKVRLIICAGIHGRENLNTTVMFKMIEEYCQGIKKQSNTFFCHERGKSLSKRFENNSIVIIPLVNPDGYEIVRDGPKVIEDSILQEKVEKYLYDNDIAYFEYKNNALGVDINRDFFSPQPQPETRALIKTFKRFECKYFIDFHSRGDSIYYYRNAMNCRYNRWQKLVASRMAEYNGYELMSPDMETEPGDSATSSVHYFSKVLKGHSFTIETVRANEDFPLPCEYIKEIFALNCFIPLMFI